MAYSLYDATVAMAISALTSLDGIISAAEAHGAETVLQARLVEDMRPLAFQVHYAAFEAQNVAAKLSRREYTESSEWPASYDEMHAVIREARTALEQVDKDAANEIGETKTPFTVRDETKELPVKAVVAQKCMPNVYFHVAMSYAILRKDGVPLQKRDWSRPFVAEYV